MQSAIKAAEAMPVSLEEAWSECERELSVRRRCYDQWVADGKVSWADARDRYARMKAAAKAMRALIEQAEQTEEKADAFDEVTDSVKNMPPPKDGMEAAA